MKKFLTAKWVDLVMANYKFSPNILQKYVPNGTTLDYWNNECYVSLVAFQFAETKVLGFKIPFHINFEEVNLRFYVKRETKDEIRRGVVFVKEIVPRVAIAFVARTFYGEPYQTWKMGHQHNESELSYWWSRNRKTNRILVDKGSNLGVPESNSHGAFIIEHYWGYTKHSSDRTSEYKVEHPKWELFDVNYAEIDVDFGFTYGEEFKFLSEMKPTSILLAKGSEIAVYKNAAL